MVALILEHGQFGPTPMFQWGTMWNGPRPPPLARNPRQGG